MDALIHSLAVIAMGLIMVVSYKPVMRDQLDIASARLNIVRGLITADKYSK